MAPSEANDRMHSNMKRNNLIMTDYLSLFSVVILCFSICRTGHETGYIPVLYTTIIVIALNIFRLKDVSVSKFKPALPFFVMTLFATILQAIFLGFNYSLSNAFSALLLFAVFVLCATLLILPNNLSHHIWKIINFVVTTASVLILVEYIAFLFGVRLYSLPVLGDWIFNAWEFRGSGAFRPCAYFSEASHFAELALLSAFYYLFIVGSLPKFSLVAVACFVSTSSLGIIGCIGMVLAYVFFFAFSRQHLMKSGKGNGALIGRLILIILSCIALMAAILYLQSSDSWFATRIMDGSTSSMRVSRSFELYGIMSPFEQLFGIGLQNQAIYLNTNGIILPSDYNETLVNREYAATGGYILCTCGIFGLLAFLYMFLPGLRNKSGKVKTLTCLLVYIALTCCVLSRSVFIIMLLMLLAYGSGYWEIDEEANG